MSEKKLPPLIQNFIEVQKQHPSAIVCTEVGSFFEIWQVGEIGHAKEAAQILDIVLTRRDKSDLNSPHMCGFPAFACDNHFKKLVQAGKTVVVVSQSVKGKKSDQIKNVKREISQIISPGTVIENISKDRPNYFASIFSEDGYSGISLIDVSTGEVIITEMRDDDAKEFLEIKNPSEILIEGNISIKTAQHQLLHQTKDPIKKLSSCGKILSEVYDLQNPTSNPTNSISQLGLQFLRIGTLALSNLLNYLTEYNQFLLKKVSCPKIHYPNKHLYVPPNAFLSLDIFKTISGKDENSDTLVGIIDRCKTAMGQRKLRDWIQSPLSEISEIESRHQKVEDYIKKGEFLSELKNVYDFARLSRRMAIKRLMPHEIVHLAESLKTAKDVLAKEKNEYGFSVSSEIYEYISDNIELKEADGISELSRKFFKDYATSDLDIIYNKWKLDEKNLNSYKDKIEKILDCTGKLRVVEKTESFQLTGPKSLALAAKEKKISIQIKASEIQITEENWVALAKNCIVHRHQFLAEASILWDKFQTEFIDKFGESVIKVSECVSELDVLSTFALISKERGYNRPVLVNKNHSYLNIKAMRHPIVELSKKLTEGFVSNDLMLGNENKTLVIYGANSAGKSTILKALALNIIMSQIGCFISAAPSSELSVFDSILTRMTTNDSLSDGLSTFTLEMSELQQALRFRDKKSVFLFDEIGRGTSVEDGEAIAFGTLLYLDGEKNNSVTLFATHYHSLVPELSNLKSILIKNVSCYTDENGILVFSRKLEDGPGTGSYGIEVAKSCGIPHEIIVSASRYKKVNFKIKTSRYNQTIEETSCEYCNKNPAQQTHHIVEQKQGRIKKYIDGNHEKKINDKSNLVMLCATCHEMVTRGEIKITRKHKKVTGGFKLED